LNRLARPLLLQLVLTCSFAGGTLLAESMDWHLWVSHEMSFLRPSGSSLFNPEGRFFDPRITGNDLLVGGRLSEKLSGDRVRVEASGSYRLSREEKVQNRVLLREAYAVLTVNDHWDLSVGKKLVKWGTGYGYNPSGFVDPPKDPRDPADRLELNQGTELVQANYVNGQNTFDLVYFAPRLFFARDPIRSRDRLAMRYNRFWRGVDLSGMVLLASGEADRLGCNFSYVLGSRLELHGELALHRQRPGLDRKGQLLVDLGPGWLDQAPETAAFDGRPVRAQSVIGGTYAPKGGWTVIVEWHHDGEGLSSAENHFVYDRLRQQSLGAVEYLENGNPSAGAAIMGLMDVAGRLSGIRANRDTLFLVGSVSWGRERFSLQNVLLGQFQDRSAAWIPQLFVQMGRHWQVYARHCAFLGKPASEFGSSIYTSLSNLGLRYNF
jgi:hypothetical protein